MNSADQASIIQWRQAIGEALPIELTLTLDDRSRSLQGFCEDLRRLVPTISLKTEKEDQSQPPAIRIGNVHYQAVPTGKELEPFLESLAAKKALAGRLPLALRQQLDQLRIPAPLKVYMTLQCPFCPVAVGQLLSLAAASEFVRLTVIDAMLFADLAQADRVQSAPTVLLDNHYRWIGQLNVAEVVDMILNRDPARLSKDALEDMFKAGEAGSVAEMMIAGNSLIPAFLELLVHEKWPVRLGAMVAFETLAARSRNLAAQAAGFLWGRFEQASDIVKGDILYLLGQSAPASMIPTLEALLGGTYPPDVLEAAQEALDTLRRS